MGCARYYSYCGCRIFIFQKPKPTELQHATVGIQTSPAMALVMVAKDKGFFEKQGLDVELKEFAAGKDALAAFLGGSLDFSISGDVPVTLSTLAGNKFVVPAQVVGKTKNEVRVVAKMKLDWILLINFQSQEAKNLLPRLAVDQNFLPMNFLTSSVSLKIK